MVEFRNIRELLIFASMIRLSFLIKLLSGKNKFEIPHYSFPTSAFLAKSFLLITELRVFLALP